MKKTPLVPRIELPLNLSGDRQWKAISKRLQKNNIKKAVIGKWVLSKLIEAEKDGFDEVKKFI